MPFKIYKGGSQLSNGERDILSSLSDVLSKQYSNSPYFCYLFVGFECNDRQIATTQGDLVIEPRQERLGRGRGENPFEQVRQ